MPLPWPNIFVTRTLKCSLFVVANFLVFLSFSLSPPEILISMWFDFTLWSDTGQVSPLCGGGREVNCAKILEALKPPRITGCAWPIRITYLPHYCTKFGHSRSNEMYVWVSKFFWMVTWLTPKYALSYLTGKACYCLVLRPPVGPLCIPNLTLRLLKPLGVFSKLQQWVPMLLS